MYSIYDTLSGEIQGTVLDESTAIANTSAAQSYIAGGFNGSLEKVVDGVVVAKELVGIDPVVLARDLRSEFLKDSDWTQTLDSPLSADAKAAWGRYRQALRDFPARSDVVALDPVIDDSQLISMLPTSPE
jgi:hypothetical protein